MRYLFAATLIGTILLAGCSGKDNVDPSQSPAPAATTSAATAPSTPDATQIAVGYEHLKLMTKEPVQVGRGMIALLAAPAAPAGGTSARYGPHANGSIRIFMNDLAADAFGKPARPFPVGSVIVKEKQPREFGVGGMIKRAAGYDPEHGDWEYFYFDEPAKVDSGKLTSCAQCHDRAADTDYLFGEWAERGSTR